MITIPPNIQNILQGIEIETFYCVAIGPYQSTSYFRDLTLATYGLFVADGNLLGVDPPASNSVVTKADFNTQIADPALILGAYAEGGLVGMQMTVHLGFVDNDVPLVGANDTIVVYRGKVSGTAYRIDTNERGRSIFNVQGSSPMSDLDHTRPYWTNKEFVRQLRPGDSSFDSNAEGSGTVVLGWGKA